MFYLCHIDRKQSKASKKWRIGFGGSAKMEKMVFGQALMYTLSFYLTWPVVLLVYVTGWDYEMNKDGFSIVVATVAPLQGFSNFLVYTRPRMTEFAKSVRSSVSHHLSRTFGTTSSDNFAISTPSSLNMQLQQRRARDPSVVIAEEKQNPRGCPRFCKGNYLN